MPRIGVASTNHVKSRAVLGAFQRVFEGEPFESIQIAVASGVSDQPMSDEETLRGALNRLAAAREALPDCDYWAAIEGGIDETEAGMVGLAWIVVASPSNTGRGRSATFPLPEPLAELVRQGVELGVACDRLYDQEGSKHREGAIGLLSHGLIDRQQLYEHAAVMALLPLRNPDRYGVQR